MRHTRLAFRHDLEHEPTWRCWYDGFVEWIGEFSEPKFENKVQKLRATWNIYEKLSVLDMVVKYSQKNLSDEGVRDWVNTLIERLGKEDEYVTALQSRTDTTAFFHVFGSAIRYRDKKSSEHPHSRSQKHYRL